MLPALCSADAFSYPSIPGAQVLPLEASYKSNVSEFIPEFYYYNHGNVMAQNVDFCNVTVTYQHLEKKDTVRVGGISGNGYTAGFTSTTEKGMVGAVAEGYVAVTTDSGHTGTGVLTDNPSDWAFLSDGGLDYDSIEDLASLSMNDAALFAKSLALSVYGSEPRYSYWTGCSQGGRQGLMLAQKYPGLYDGIEHDTYPYPCEIDAVVAAATSACDVADGLIDGIVSDPYSCAFDPFTTVGTKINCSDTGTQRRISNATVQVVNASWTGPRDSDGQFLWYGYNMGAVLTGSNGVAATECSKNSTVGCVGAPSALFLDWLEVFVEQDQDFSLDNITTRADYDFIYKKSLQQWRSVLGTNNPDLSEFRNAGGKMLTYHGLMDETIPSRGSRYYYDAVRAQDSEAQDYYRFYEAPMMGHCYGSSGGYPSTIFDSVVAWVENGTVPESLPVSYTPKNGKTYDRILCPYPQRVHYDGTGNVTLAGSFYCAE
ncbi:Tannase/feruloyl esterase [Aspergillus cavernicola]|uniref:Carboxylic ester hydrolase n=1 Tax=Aspergillus cavernicola TaxID=176166 RepID=A0ABR4I1K6_9EURO